MISILTILLDVPLIVLPGISALMAGDGGYIMNFSVVPQLELGGRVRPNIAGRSGTRTTVKGHRLGARPSRFRSRIHSKEGAIVGSGGRYSQGIIHGCRISCMTSCGCGTRITARSHPMISSAVSGSAVGLNTMNTN